MRPSIVGHAFKDIDEIGEIKQGKFLGRHTFKLMEEWTVIRDIDVPLSKQVFTSFSYLLISVPCSNQQLGTSRLIWPYQTTLTVLRPALLSRCSTARLNNLLSAHDVFYLCFFETFFCNFDLTSYVFDVNTC